MAARNMCSPQCRKYLLQFANEHIDFRISEIKAVYQLLGIREPIDERNYDKRNPFFILSLPSEDVAKSIMKRSMLVKICEDVEREGDFFMMILRKCRILFFRSVYEVWGEGSSEQELQDSIKQYPHTDKVKFLESKETFRIHVDAYNKSLPTPDKLAKIEGLLEKAVPFQGRVNLKKPEHSYHLLEYYGPEGTVPSETPLLLYFGRWLSDGPRDLIQKYTLKQRKFIGNTSMDAGLSFIMANMGLVEPNMLVFDPFVGTGSLLVSCAHHRSYVMGTDIDFNIIYGKGKASRHNQKWRGSDENIRANLQQYGLSQYYLDALVADASIHSMWNLYSMFDAIITDPPYGIREPTQKLGTKKDVPTELTEEHRTGNIPSKKQYHISEVYKDLLNFSAKFLKIGARLVYWLPIYRPDYVEANIPRHPCLRLVANSEQPLSRTVGRRLITMEKTSHPQDAAELNGAVIAEDHYQDASFREKYFNASNANQENNKDLTNNS